MNKDIEDKEFEKRKDPKPLDRIDGKYVWNEISSVINFDRGLFYTIRELLIKPGSTVRKFLFYDRKRIVKPMVFLIVCSLIYTLFQQLLHFEDGYVSAEGFGDSAITNILNWIQKNYGYANILMSIFIAIWIKLFFRKYDYNFYEIIILLCFIMGIGMLIYTISGILESITKLKILQIGAILGFIYTAWSIGRFFEKNKKRNYLKGIFAYILGMVTFYFLAVILGSGIELISKIQ
ncbi:DUF3667 domain-containing protein [Pareuzebyella sediminis]|uniref:DUF3667 domain-containing protein n=1 Tax=Pareuzebyella sediminis TaxID=2607998 RepID=UPI0011ECECEC|nr:DUF3667 domain-containing protein [Pareuzebyella sediminis]